MAAERKNASDTQRREHLTLVALYEFEERANELLERLGALSIDTSEASIVRVELSQTRTAEPPALPQAAPLSPLMRSSVTGAFIGGGAALLVGVLLYEAGFLNLPFAEGLFSHAFVSVVVGAIIGAMIGALVSTTKKIHRPPVPAPVLQHLASEGFLVVVKMQPHLAEQAEAIARRLGAKEILL